MRSGIEVTSGKDLFDAVRGIGRFFEAFAANIPELGLDDNGHVTSARFARLQSTS